MRGTQYLLPLILLFGCQEPIEKEKAIRPVKALQIQDPASVSGRAFPGRTRAEDRVNLSFRVSGPLVQRQAKVGDIVKKDEILAQIDPRDFEVKL